MPFPHLLGFVSFRFQIHLFLNPKEFVTRRPPQGTFSAALPSAVRSWAGAVAGRGTSLSRAANEGCDPGPGRAGSLRGGPQAAFEEETQQHGPPHDPQPCSPGRPWADQKQRPSGSWDGVAGPSPALPKHAQPERWNSGRGETAVAPLPAGAGQDTVKKRGGVLCR